MMSFSLLGVLLSTCLSSAMFVLPPTRYADDIDHNNTFPMPGFSTPETGPEGPWGNSRQGSFPVGPGDPGDPVNPSICDILLNAPIPPPISQVPWYCVCSHCKFKDGLKGDRGDRGLTGAPGSPGIRGLIGMRGPPGFVGQQGLKGQKGDDGPKGDQGPIGFVGIKGDRGYKGDKGDRGFDGLQGEAGPPGEMSQCPTSCTSMVGPPGPSGSSGPVGPKGLAGVPGAKGESGPKGDMGDRGLPGQPGSSGSKGEQGKMGMCNCTDGAKGADGLTGPPGARGDKGDTGVLGPQGLTGQKGSQGDMGMDGIPGPCSPTIQSAFSAAMLYSFPMANLPIPFPRIIYNMQMNFNPNTGVYQAPVNGTYSFSFHLTVYSKVLKVGLFLNYVPVFKVTEPNNFAIASHQVVLHLNRGDRVWLQAKDINTNGIFVDTESSSTFTGFLLYPDSCDMAFTREAPELVTGTYSWGEVSTQSPETTNVE